MGSAPLRWEYFDRRGEAKQARCFALWSRMMDIGNESQSISQLTIPDLDDGTVARLRDRAARHGRTVSSWTTSPRISKPEDHATQLDFAQSTNRAARKHAVSAAQSSIPSGVQPTSVLQEKVAVISFTLLLRHATCILLRRPTTFVRALRSPRCDY